jgi:basic amino acid/polyamine antiporter, APA family
MPDARDRLARELTLPAAAALVVGQVIAVGIFLTPGTIIRTLASPLLVLVVWAIIGAMAMCGAICYGTLAAWFPRAGGGYVYLREAYGPLVAFLYGWKCFLVMDPGITAALATGFATYVSVIVPLGPVVVRLVGIGAIVVLALVHIAGVKPGARMLTAMTVLKLALILALIVLAFANRSGNWSHFLPFASRPPAAPPLGRALAGALVAAFFSFGGWWEVAKISGEVKDPARTMPRALLAGLLVVTVVYVVVTVAFMYVVPIDQVGPPDAFVAQVGAVLLGPTGAGVLSLVIIVCVLGSLAAMMMLAPRVYVAMAHDGVFPAAASAIDPRFGTPARAIAAQAVLASVLVALGSFNTIVAYFIFITVSFIALTVAGVFILGRRTREFHVPGHPWTALCFLAIVFVLLLLLLMNNPIQAMVGAGIVALGVPVYYMATRSVVRQDSARQEV